MGLIEPKMSEDEIDQRLREEAEKRPAEGGVIQHWFLEGTGVVA